MSDMALHNKVVLITGGAKRLGAAIADKLHAEGARIAIHYHHSQQAATLLAEKFNQQRQQSAITIATDLLSTDSLPSIVERCINEYGQLDVLVNNASAFYPTPVGSITEMQWNELIGSNLKAPLFLAQAAAPHLKRTQGLILNMVDVHAQRPLVEHPVYSIAKAGLVTLTKSLARELGPDIRVNGIAPGPILWPEHEMSSERQHEIINKTALRRQGSPDDIARAALFFVKDAPYVTGQVLAVDGGRSIGW